MRKHWLFLSALLVVCVSITVFPKAKIGPSLDTVYFDVRMQEDIGIQDVAAGKTDIFYYGLDGSKVKGLDRATLEKLEIYAIPSGSWSLLFNPVPNAAPYTVKVGEKEYFNPFAIREVRYAMNWLINRQYIVDEILAGAGGPMFTMATPGQPGTYRYNLIAAKLGMTAEGDEKKALAAIEAAMKKAAALEANQGKLKKEGDWWTFNGEPVTIKFLIRVDDPSGRLKEGQYIAKQIEKAGLKGGAAPLGSGQVRQYRLLLRPGQIRVEHLYRGLGRRRDPGLLGSDRLPDVRAVLRQHAGRSRSEQLELQE